MAMISPIEKERGHNIKESFVSSRSKLYIRRNTFVCMNNGMYLYASFLLADFRMSSDSSEKQIGK